MSLNDQSHPTAVQAVQRIKQEEDEIPSPPQELSPVDGVVFIDENFDLNLHHQIINLNQTTATVLNEKIFPSTPTNRTAAQKLPGELTWNDVPNKSIHLLNESSSHCSKASAVGQAELDYEFNKFLTSNAMSIVDEKNLNDSFNFDHQNEEHFEFTPSNGSILDDEFIYSNSDSSFNSSSNVKLNFLQRNTAATSSYKKSSSLSNYPKRNNYASPTNCLNGLNISPRSSISYESDEMNNEHNSMEDYVFQLTEKLKKLQDQVQNLREGQAQNDEKYSTIKKENSTLHNKINYLEEQIRDIELQSEEKRIVDEQRFKESMARIEREKTQELENCFNRICSLQKDLVEAKEENKRQQQTIEKLQLVKSQLENTIQDKYDEIETLQQEIRKLRDVIRLKNEERQVIDSTLIEALNQSVGTNGCDDLDTSSSFKLDNGFGPQAEIMSNINSELEQQLRILKDENRSLKEANEELTAQLLNNHLIEGKSLLKENEAISSLANEISDLNQEQLKTALKEQKDVNAKLRSYIDGILLNIVENYPQLLEVKSNGSA